MSESDRRYLRYAIMIAERAREHGSPPFGAILVSSQLGILSEGENTRHRLYLPRETNLLHEATRRFSRNLLAHSTMYTSAEPCPMCTGAVFWSSIGRIVFGLSSERLYALTQDKAEHIFEHCANLRARGTHRVEVCPMLEDEAESVFQTTTTLTNAPYAEQGELTRLRILLMGGALASKRLRPLAAPNRPRALAPAADALSIKTAETERRLPELS